jgi:hypothetical protein
MHRLNCARLQVAMQHELTVVQCIRILTIILTITNNNYKIAKTYDDDNEDSGILSILLKILLLECRLLL